jgi:hypothetical protein
MWSDREYYKGVVTFIRDGFGKNIVFLGRVFKNL